MENKIFVLNPDYHFKNDIDRVALFSGMRVNDYSEKDWSSYIHPLQAMILNSFSEEKSLKYQYNELSSTLSIPVDTVETMIKPYMENETSVYTEFAGEEILFPKNVLVSRDKLKGARKIECEDYSLFDCENVNLKQDRLHKAPQTMLFMVTSKCVTNCKYCYADRKTKYDQMSTEQILKIIDEAASLKMTNVDVIRWRIHVEVFRIIANGCKSAYRREYPELNGTKKCNSKKMGNLRVLQSKTSLQRCATFNISLRLLNF